MFYLALFLLICNASIRCMTTTTTAMMMIKNSTLWKSIILWYIRCLLAHIHNFKPLILESDCVHPNISTDDKHSNSTPFLYSILGSDICFFFCVRLFVCLRFGQQVGGRISLCIFAYCALTFETCFAHPLHVDCRAHWVSKKIGFNFAITKYK